MERRRCPGRGAVAVIAGTGEVVGRLYPGMASFALAGRAQVNGVDVATVAGNHRMLAGEREERVRAGCSIGRERHTMRRDHNRLGGDSDGDLASVTYRRQNVDGGDAGHTGLIC